MNTSNPIVIDNSLFDSFYKINVKGESIEMFIGPEIEKKAIFFDKTGRYLGIVINVKNPQSNNEPIKKFSLNNDEVKKDETYIKIQMEKITINPINYQVGDILFYEKGNVISQIDSPDTEDRIMKTPINLIAGFIEEQQSIYKLINSTQFIGGFYVYEIDPKKSIIRSNYSSKITGIVLQRQFDKSMKTDVAKNLVPLNPNICAYFKLVNGAYDRADEAAIQDFMNSNNKYFPQSNTMFNISKPEEFIDKKNIIEL